MDTNRHEPKGLAAAEGQGACRDGKVEVTALDRFLQVRDAEPGFTPRTKDWTDLRKRLINEGRVSREEGLSQADSPTNLMWRLQNADAPKAPAAERALLDQVDEPTFTDITLDVRF